MDQLHVGSRQSVSRIIIDACKRHKCTWALFWFGKLTKIKKKMCLKLALSNDILVNYPRALHILHKNEIMNRNILQHALYLTSKDVETSVPQCSDYSFLPTFKTCNCF